MPPSSTVRRLFLAVALLLLLGLAWTGLSNGYSLLAPAQSVGQKVQAFTQMALGVFGFLVIVTTFPARRWRPLVLTCFAITLSIASGVLVVVWNRSPVFVGLLTGAMALLVAWAIIWLLRKGLAV
jgi:hypothetical protein